MQYLLTEEEYNNLVPKLQDDTNKQRQIRLNEKWDWRDH
jgi:hypothetical protein